MSQGQSENDRLLGQKSKGQTVNDNLQAKKSQSLSETNELLGTRGENCKFSTKMMSYRHKHRKNWGNNNCWDKLLRSKKNWRAPIATFKGPTKKWWAFGAKIQRWKPKNDELLANNLQDQSENNVLLAHKFQCMSEISKLLSQKPEGRFKNNEQLLALQSRVPDDNGKLFGPKFAMSLRKDLWLHKFGRSKINEERVAQKIARSKRKLRAAG